MGEEFFPFVGMGWIFSRIKIDILLMGKGLSTEIFTELNRIGTRVNFDATKVIPKPFFHEITGFIW